MCLGAGAGRGGEEGPRAAGRVYHREGSLAGMCERQGQRPLHQGRGGIEGPERTPIQARELADKGLLVEDGRCGRSARHPTPTLAEGFPLPEGSENMGRKDLMTPPPKPKSPLTSSPTSPSRPGADGFEGGPKPGAGPTSHKPVLSGENTNSSARPVFTGVAPEVRQSRWHDRSTAPRGVLPTEAVTKGLDEALQKAQQASTPVAAVRAQLKAEWLPLVRQVVEQAGGDGLDAYVTQLLYPPGRQAETTLVADLGKGMDRLEAASDAQAMVRVALELRATLARTLEEKSPRAVSLDLQERELDGRVDVDTLLFIRFASAAELANRRARTDKTMEVLRLQMRNIPGPPPEGLLSSFFRAKVEKRVMEAEARRRAGP